MKKKIINVFLMALISLVAVGTVVSCKDYEEDNYSELNGKFTNLKEAVEAQAKALEDRVGKLEEARTLIETDIQNLRNELGNVTDDATKTTIYGRLAAAEAAIETINNTIDEIKTTLDGKADQDALDKLTERVEKVEGCCEAIKELQGRVTTNEQEIDALQALIDADKVKVWEDGIADATSNAAKALALAQMDSIRLDRMEAWGDSIEGVLGDDFEDFKESVASALYDAENNVWKNLDDVIDEQLNLVKGSYTGTMEDIVKAVAQIKQIEHRLEIKEINGYTFIDNAFNSNPVSSKNSLDVLKMMDGMRVIVTPGLIDLGHEEARYNKEFGAYMPGRVDLVLLVGPLHTKPIYEGLIEAGFNQDKILVFDTVKEAFNYIYMNLNKDATILLENDLPDAFSH